MWLLGTKTKNWQHLFAFLPPPPISQIIKLQDAVMTNMHDSLCSTNWKCLQVSAAVIPCNFQRHVREQKSRPLLDLPRHLN